jgi:hypothetical protein
LAALDSTLCGPSSARFGPCHGLRWSPVFERAQCRVSLWQCCSNDAGIPPSRGGLRRLRLRGLGPIVRDSSARRTSCRSVPCSISRSDFRPRERLRAAWRTWRWWPPGAAVPCRRCTSPEVRRVALDPTRWGASPFCYGSRRYFPRSRGGSFPRVCCLLTRRHSRAGQCRSDGAGEPLSRCGLPALRLRGTGPTMCGGGIWFGLSAGV